MACVRATESERDWHSAGGEKSAVRRIGGKTK